MELERETVLAQQWPSANGLTTRQKTAVLLMTLPPELSIQLISELGADRVHSVIMEITQLPPITSDIRESIVNEFLVSTLTKPEKAAILVLTLPPDLQRSLKDALGPAERKILERALEAHEEVSTLTRFAVVNEFMLPEAGNREDLAHSKGWIYELFETMVRERPSKVANLLLEDWLGGEE